MYISRGTLLNIFLFLKKMWEFINKHFYVVLILTTITKYTNTKFYQSFVWIIKVFVLANIIFGVGYIIYFSVAEHSFILGIQFYQDLITNYFNSLFDTLNNFWNDLIHIDLEDKVINHSSNNKDAIAQIKQELNVSIKQGIREGINEAVNEALDRLEDIEAESKSNMYKNIAFVGGILFLGYFCFVIPNDASPEVLSQFNWFNQSLIEVKSNILDLIFGNNRGGGGNAPVNPIDLTTSPIY
jgi:hypothetical protein